MQTRAEPLARMGLCLHKTHPGRILMRRNFCKWPNDRSAQRADFDEEKFLQMAK